MADSTPSKTEGGALWIIDYKTAHAEPLAVASTVAALRKSFAPQLEMYASILRGLHGDGIPMRAGLYYPRMSAFDWWEI